MSEVIFNYNGINTTILCSRNQTTKEIFLNYCLKIQKDINDLIFLYGGNEINLNLTLDQISNQLDIPNNKINILVYNKNTTIKNNNNIKESKDQICPKCGECCRIKIDNYKIRLFHCKNNHDNNISISEYDYTQKIDESRIKCNKCNKTKNESFNNLFYICGICNIKLCPLCSSIHNKEHKLIEYDSKNYLCIKHKEQFISYCEICKLNLCLQCELEHNNNHKIITFKSIYPNINIISNKMKEIENIIDEFNNDINNIIDILTNTKNTINKYHEINKKILANFDINERNYQILQNINDIYSDNIITEDLNEIIKEKNCINKVNKIYYLYNKINFNNLSIFNKNVNDKIIEKNNSSNNSNSFNFSSKELTSDSYAYSALDNTFCIFNSFENIYYLVYANKSKSIIFYNLIDNKIIKEIKNAHYKYIINFRHYPDNICRKDFVLTVSDDRNVKLWSLDNFNCLCDIYAYKGGHLNAACFLNNISQKFFLICNSNFDISEKIKIFNFKGEEIKEINDSNEITYFMDIYYDNDLNKNYIITGNKGYLKSYYFNNNKLYHKYYDRSAIEIKGHFSVIISRSENTIKLIDSSFDGFVRIWNFHSNILLNKINLNSGKLYGICLFNEDNIFIGCEDKTMKLLNIKNMKVIKEFKGHEREVITIKKAQHFILGECIVSKGRGKEQIKIWNDFKSK